MRTLGLATCLAVLVAGCAGSAGGRADAAERVPDTTRLADAGADSGAADRVPDTTRVGDSDADPRAADGVPETTRVEDSGVAPADADRAPETTRVADSGADSGASALADVAARPDAPLSADGALDAAPDAPGPPPPAGVWRCVASGWAAETTVRTMEGRTQFECGWFHCGDMSHTQPTTWVDIVGGLSMSCEDHSSSFFGPEGGEWDGCSGEHGDGPHQESRGAQPIEGLDQGSSIWPRYWVALAGDHAPAGLAALLDDHAEALAGPFATVYDLDGCLIRQLVGTVYYGDLSVVSRRVEGDPSRPDRSRTLAWSIEGASDGLRCSDVEGDCTNVVCSDLRVWSTFRCAWVPDADSER